MKMSTNFWVKNILLMRNLHLTCLALKKEFKKVTGKEWKPGVVASLAPATSPAPSSSGSGDINAAVAAQGDLVRKLKADKAAKADIDEAVKKLIALKADFKAATGIDWKPGCQVPESKPDLAQSSSTGEF